MNRITFTLTALTATVKTLLSPPIGFLGGLDFTQTLTAVLLGSYASFVCFFFLSDRITTFWKKTTSKKARLRQFCRAKKIIKMKRNLPTWLFLSFMPILSIPVMAVTVRVIYCRNKSVFLGCLLILTIWGTGECLAYLPMFR